LEGFSYVLQIDMHFICTPMWTKFYSCEKWVLQFPSTKHGWGTKHPIPDKAPPLMVEEEGPPT
jgi:hypothetical protein